MPIPTSDPRHPAHLDFKPLDGERGRFADRHARRADICPDCGLIRRHRGDCPTNGEATPA